MELDKQKWVEDLLNSSMSMHPIKTVDMTDAILNRIYAGSDHHIGRADSSYIWRIAASVVLLLLLNTVIIYSHQSRVSDLSINKPNQDVATAFGFSQNNNNDLGTTIFGN